MELVVLCGGEDKKKILDKTGRNAVYTSHVAVEFMYALGTWVEESARTSAKLLVSASWLMSVQVLQP